MLFKIWREKEKKGNPLILRLRFCSLVTIRPWYAPLPSLTRSAPKVPCMCPAFSGQLGAAISPSPWPWHSFSHSSTLGLSLNSTCSLLPYLLFLPIRISSPYSHNMLFIHLFSMYFILPRVRVHSWTMWFSLTGLQASGRGSTHLHSTLHSTGAQLLMLSLNQCLRVYHVKAPLI